MKISLLSVGDAAEQLNIAVRARIQAVFSVFAEEDCPIGQYADFKQLLRPLSDSLADKQFTVVFAGSDCFESVKQSLIRALHLKCELSLDIIEQLPEDMSAVRKELHGMFPVNAVVFPSSDGMYSAFCSRSGTQYLLLCPLCGNYMHVLENDIYRFLSRTVSLPSDAGEPYIMLFRRVASVLSQRNLSVAVAATQTADFVRTPASMGGRNASCFKFSSLPVPPCDCEPQDHTARAASSAASACNTVLGVAMSNIFLLKRNGSEQYVVYIAVAHDTNVTVSRVYSGDLPVKDFLKKTACELFSLLSCIVEALYGNAEPDDFEVF